jgi:membrane protease YdiL (CAAX protease family)
VSIVDRAESRGHGGFYAETFAVWMLLYIGLSYTLAMLPVQQNRLLLAGFAMLTSLTALAWPVARGVPWRQVREDVGLNLGPLKPGRPRWLEPFAGLGCYATALPLLFAGVLAMLALMAIQRAIGGAAPRGLTPHEKPTHPIVGWVLKAGWWGRLLVFLVASVIAPIVEETMFRGVLLRYLRDATWRWGFIASALASATLVSFVFAAIHPQGWLAIPALMALSFAFCLFREWRGTLVPAIVAHGMNNGLVMWLLMSLA